MEYSLQSASSQLTIPQLKLEHDLFLKFNIDQYTYYKH